MTTSLTRGEAWGNCSSRECCSTFAASRNGQQDALLRWQMRWLSPPLYGEEAATDGSPHSRTSDAIVATYREHGHALVLRVKPDEEPDG